MEPNEILKHIQSGLEAKAKAAELRQAQIAQAAKDFSEIQAKVQSETKTLRDGLAELGVNLEIDTQPKGEEPNRETLSVDAEFENLRRSLRFLLEPDGTRIEVRIYSDGGGESESAVKLISVNSNAYREIMEQVDDFLSELVGIPRTPKRAEHIRKICIRE